jgi:hypothetical protein
MQVTALHWSGNHDADEFLEMEISVLLPSQEPSQGLNDFMTVPYRLVFVSAAHW